MLRSDTEKNVSKPTLRIALLPEVRHDGGSQKTEQIINEKTAFRGIGKRSPLK
jgi:hypothetical protein